ncbi:MAG: hypothetical protein K0M45_11455 [Candidatus Paracaedibacteraceae bacterium]|nr:hypothetical protein [Candidatus Paracaedibacteraceae bacterium]
MKILTTLLILRSIAVAESEDTLSASNHAILAKNNLESFLTETLAATSDQILFRADSVFTSDTAYNRFFSVLVEDVQSASISESLEFYLANINKLHHLWINYISIADSHAKKLMKTAMKKVDSADRHIIRLEAIYKTIRNIHNYLDRWGSTIINLSDNQFKKAQALNYSDPVKRTFFSHLTIDDTLNNLARYSKTLEVRLQQKRKQQRNKENQLNAGDIPKVEIPSLNLKRLKEDEILQIDATIKSPRQLTPRRLLKSLSDRILGSSHKKVEVLGDPPLSCDRNTIIRAKSVDECQKRF